MLRQFLERFNFRPKGKLLVGVERECFLLNLNNEIVPIAPQVLDYLPDTKHYGYELSACQLEDRVGPCCIDKVKASLLKNEAEIKQAESALNFKRSFCEVAPVDMPLDIYPDPDGRYQRITKNMPRRILLAACRVIGTHIHIGMPDHKSALNVYNEVTAYTDELCQLGNGSNGERLAIYKVVAPNFEPPHYSGWDDFYQEAKENDFVADPRSCWHIIRLSVHGTIEFRMFGATTNLDKIVKWAQRCHSLCKNIL